MKKRKVIGTITTYPAFDAFRRYMYGKGTLEDFRKAPGSVTEPIYGEEESSDGRAGVPIVLSLVWGFFLGTMFGMALAWGFQ